MSTISSGTTLTTALVQTGDTTGDLVIKTNNGNTTAVTFNTVGAIGVGSSPSYGSVGQYLQSAGNAAAATWATVASSQWTTTGSDIYYNAGNVGVGTSSPAQKLDVASTTGNIAISVRSTFANASSSVYYGASRGWFVGADVGGGDGRFAWYDNTAGAERMRIDSSGNVQLSTAGTSILNSSGRKILNQTGSILQVVSYQGNDQFTSTSSGTVDTGFQASITPSSTSSRILVMFTIHAANASGNGHYQLGIKRNGTKIWQGQSTTYNKEALGGVFPGNADNLNTAALSAIDSPSSISAVTYSLYFEMTPGNGTTMALNRSTGNNDTGYSSIVLMEIAA
jgi:hypothetical protein